MVHAQQKMREENEADQWVLRAAVRNGTLAWRPNPEQGTLEKVTEQQHAKTLNSAWEVEDCHLNGSQTGSSGLSPEASPRAPLSKARCQRQLVLCTTGCARNIWPMRLQSPANVTHSCSMCMLLGPQQLSGCAQTLACVEMSLKIVIRLCQVSCQHSSERMFTCSLLLRLGLSVLRASFVRRAGEETLNPKPLRVAVSPW